jgi:hypothetical protein
VPLDPELREYVERMAAREDRSLAGQIRHFVAEAARAAGSGPPAKDDGTWGEIGNPLQEVGYLIGDLFHSG